MKRYIYVLIIMICTLLLIGCKKPKPEHVHEYISSVIEPTCDTKGYTEYKCNCEDTYIDNEVEPLGHSYSEWVQIVKPSEENVGIEERICSRCNKKEYNQTPELEHVHVFVGEVIAPTCTEKGYTSYTCYCGKDSYIEDYVDMLGHDLSVVIDERPASDYAVGYEFKQCSRCEYTEYFETPSFMNVLEYKLVGQGYVVSGFRSESYGEGLLSIPMEYNGYPVIGISSRVFAGENSIKDIEISINVKNIDESAFEGCFNLESVTFIKGSKLTLLGRNSFYECNNLKTINIPSSVQSIDEGTFYNCNELHTVTFEENSKLIAIAKEAFYNCSKLVNIVLPDNTRIIEQKAFAYCSSLIEINIPINIEVLEKETFANCTSLKNIIFNEKGLLKLIKEKAFYNCSKLSDIKLSPSIQKIEQQAFYNCLNMESIMLPASLMEMGPYVFEKCYCLTIFCAAESSPINWHDEWNVEGCLVVWGFDIKY